MPVLRAGTGSALHDAYLDRLLTWSDIQEYMPFLHGTAKSYDKVRILELGTRKGNSTLAFLAAAEAVGGKVTSVDIDRMPDPPDCPFWTFVQGSDTESAVQARLPAEIDVLFIDTSHEYEHTLAELRAYMPRVIPGGIALFHDTNLFGWREGLPAGIWSGTPEAGEHYPEVRQALDEYCKETGLSWENKPGFYGLGIIRP